MNDVLDGMEAEIRSLLPKGRSRRPSTVQSFLEEDISGDKTPWTLEGHEPFRGIIALLDDVLVKGDTDVEISVLKAEQVGASVTFLGIATHLVADRGRDVGYFLPTNTFATEFGRTRLKRMIAKSPYLRDLMEDRSVVNRATVKEFGSNFLYMLGLETMMGAISKPMDVLIFDEVDRLPKENKEWAQGRVTHSDLRLQLYFSAGYAPGDGIEKKYQEGSQHRFLVDCPKRRCIKAICPEETFPECMREIDGHWVRACPKCGTMLDLTKGRWVASYPGLAKKKKFSFRVSSLGVCAISGDGIMKRWFEKALKKRSEMAKFRTSVLAIPDAGALQPVTDAELAEMRAPYLMNRSRVGADEKRPLRYAGLDTAGDLCHLYVYEVEADGHARIAWLEEIDSDAVRTTVASRIGELGITQLVADKKPLVTDVRALAYQFPRQVALIDWVESSDLQVVEESHEEPRSSSARLLPHTKKYRCVKANRDESIDEFTSAITAPETRLKYPDKEAGNRLQYELLVTFERHLKALRKEVIIDAKGRTVHRYVKAVENHFGLAGAYAHLAERISPEVMPFEMLMPDKAQVAEWGTSNATRWSGYRG